MGEAGGKAGGNAGGNGNFEVGQQFRNSFPTKVRTQNAKACFGKNNKIADKNMKGIKSIKKYKRGFAIRT